VTTSSDRILLRWVPLAALLAVAMAVGLSFGPHPFGFHGWPKARAPHSVDRVVRVAPKSARVAVASREPGVRSRAADSDAPGRGDDARPDRPGQAGRGKRSPRRSSQQRRHGERRSRSDSEPAHAPVPPATEDPVVDAPDGPPVPGPIPDGAEAKPDAERGTPPPSSVEVGDGLDDYEYEDGHRYGHGAGHGDGHHGHHGHHGHGRH
jgi:hypothetical protein